MKRVIVPARMRAIEIRTPGGPEVLALCERPVPQPGAGELLIRVRAAGVNRPDVLQRLGVYPPPPGAPDLPGLEVAGEVVWAPVDSPWQPGAAVCALVAGGGYAEYCTAPVAQCLPLPAGCSFEEAAGLPETWFTVWSNLVDRAALKPGETLLVHGAASGIGTTAIQLARLMGVRVWGTAGSDERCRAAETLGAEQVFNYRQSDFEIGVRDATAGRGVDVILDMVAGSYVSRNLRCLADDGRLVIIALLGGARDQVDLSQILRRRLTITGSTLRPRPVAFKAAIAKALHEHVWPAFADGRIRPVLSAAFPLEQAARAHALMEASGAVGKIVLTVGQ
jgi:NADPH2:quinone reductase